MAPAHHVHKAIFGDKIPAAALVVRKILFPGIGSEKSQPSDESGSVFQHPTR